MTLEPGDAYAPAIIAKPLLSVVYDKQFASDNTTVAVVDGETVKALGPGTATISCSAKYRGRTYQDSGEITVSELTCEGMASARTATGIALARVPETIEVGEDYSAQAYILSEVTEDHPYPYGYADDNLTIWSSDSPEVCRVKNGVLQGIATGTATITVSDITGAVSESFTVQVVEPSALEYTENEVETVVEADHDWSTEETTTLAIISILDAASAAGKKKVVFPNRIYTVSPAYGTINVPTRMILDFSGAIIQIVESTLTATGYQMFYFKDTEYSSIVNAIIYGERDSASGSAGCQSVYFSGYNFHSGLKDCTISKSPGFNIGASHANMVRVGFKLTAIETGGIDDGGVDKEEDYCFRNNGYMDITKIGNRFGFGNMQGFQGYAYLGARCYDIFFYDTDYAFISYLKNCVQYYRYPKPEGAVYARIVFRQASAPTASDPDFASIAHIYSYDTQDHCYIRNCTMAYNNDTAIQPNHGESWLIEGCTFKDNGYSDPASHIDWEDGRNHNKGHVLRNCYFKDGGHVLVIGSDGIVVRNNIFDNADLQIRSEAQNSRVWLNQFITKGVTITTKTDMVFSQNCGYDGATYTNTAVDGVGFAVRECGNNF